MLNAAADVLDTAGTLTAEDASADLDPAVVESILGRFNDIVVDAAMSGERINPVSLHRSLHEATETIMEETPASLWHMMGLMQSREESEEGRRIHLEDPGP